MLGFTGTIVVGGRKITNLWFADDIKLIAGSNDELADLQKKDNNMMALETSNEKLNCMVTTKI